MARLVEVDEIPDGRQKVRLTEEPSEGFGARVSRELKDIPRQLGLTARAGLNGIGGTVGLLSDPIGGLINAAAGSHLLTARGLTDRLGDAVGLPKPQTDTERMVADGAELLTPGAALPKAASKVATVVSKPMAKQAMQAMAQNPLAQTVSSGAAGLAGGYARETGGDEGAQFLTSLAAGLATPYGMSKAQDIGQAASRLAKRFMTTPETMNAQINLQIEGALRQGGVNFSELPAHVQATIRNDVAEALTVNPNGLSPAAIARLADYRMTGLTPTAATVTLDPALVTQQKNLAKAGANSKDPAAQALSRVEHGNNARLIENLNEAGAGGAPGAFQTGSRLLNTLGSHAEAQQSAISDLYRQARDSQGRVASLDPRFFTNAAGAMLDREMKGGFLPQQFKDMLDGFATGSVPLNIETAEQFKTMIGNAQRGAQDGNVRRALGLVREALDNTPLQGPGNTIPALDGGGAALGQQAIDAFNQARSANRQFMQQVEQTPALSAALADAAPDAFFAKHVLNAPVRDLEATLRIVGNNPQTLQAIRAEVVNHLKIKALSGASDEVGKVSQSAFKRELDKIGDEKLRLLFSEPEIAQLRALSRVASYEQVQPVGSAVNNSNTTGALAGLVERVATSPLLAKIPLGSALQQPAQNISIGLQANRMMGVPQYLGNPAVAAMNQPPGLLMSPAALMALRGEDEKKPKGLLLP